ncbi:hypothetical protein HHI36_016795 [Cryptolaemus montrouzieri]|uniref:Uncharacterized protein n=1 Tax=Cryptolaemus montrouzieri TaxID=559131 RepID=A0ABD2NLJ9_9CUCU
MQKPDEVLTCGDLTVPQMLDIKLLGIQVDSRLDRRCHVDAVAKALSGCSYGLSVMCSVVDLNAALSFYYGAIQYSEEMHPPPDRTRIRCQSGRCG